MTTSRPQANGFPRLWVPIALILLFFGPLALAAYLYYWTDTWDPASGTQHGTLISPSRPLPASLGTGEDARTGEEILKGRWTLLYLDQGACGDRCREALQDIRQVRLALGSKRNRVQRLFLYTGSPPDRDFLRREHSDLKAVAIDARRHAELLETFPVYGEAAPIDAQRVYIVDPLGNLVMSYGPDADPKGLLEDMKRLLKLSRIG